MDFVFKVLVDVMCCQLFDLLYVKNGQMLFELCDGFVMSWQVVSKYFVLFEVVNFVVMMWCGWEKLYYLNLVLIYDIVECWIGKFECQCLQVLVDFKCGLEVFCDIGDDDG